jgi:hypothetical protein
MDKASFFRRQGMKCRRVARVIDDEWTANILLRLADEFDDEARLAAIEQAQNKAQQPSPETFDVNADPI